MNDRNVQSSLDGAFLVTFLTGLFYVAGQAYFSGKLSFYGIEASVLDLSFSESVHLGFFTIASTIFAIAYYVVIGAMFLSFIIWAIHFLSKALKIRSLNLKLPSLLTKKTDFIPIVSLLDRIHSILSGWGFFALISMFIIFFADSKLSDIGRDSEKTRYTATVSGKNKARAMTVNIQGALQKVTIIHCSSDLCALLSLDGKQVFFLKKDSLSESSITIEANPPPKG